MSIVMGSVMRRVMALSDIMGGISDRIAKRYSLSGRQCSTGSRCPSGAFSLVANERIDVKPFPPIPPRDLIYLMSTC